jgi:hypothetical protein
VRPAWQRLPAQLTALTLNLWSLLRAHSFTCASPKPHRCSSGGVMLAASTPRARLHTHTATTPPTP